MTHLDGIRVLSKQAVEIGNRHIVLTVLVCLVCIIVGLFGFALIESVFNIDSEDFIKIGIMLGIMIGVILSNIFFYDSTIDYFTYKVIMEDKNISYQDFTNTYEVLEQDSEIYTVKFKGDKL